MGVTARRWRGLTALVVAFALFAMGCGGSDTANSSPTPAPTSTSAPVADVAAGTNTAPAAEEPAEAEPAEAPDDEDQADDGVSPLFGALGIDFSQIPLLEAEREREVERLTAECMLARGFEYTPRRSGLPASVQARWELEANLSAEAFARQYGYGISTLVTNDFEGEGVLIFVEQFFGPAPSVERSEAEQRAFEIELMGRSIVGVDDDEASEQFLQGAGSLPGSCRNESFEAAGNPVNETFDGFFTLLGDEWTALIERFENDPRIVDERRDWQRCMADAGYVYETSADIVNEIQDESIAIQNALLSHPSTLGLLADAQTDEFALMNEQDRLDYLARIGVLEGFARVPELQAELDALATREVDIANTSFDCADVDLADAVFREYERAFVEDHGDQIALLALEAD